MRYRKYTEEVLKRIKDMYESGMTQAEIGTVFGLNKETISSTMRRYGILARTDARYQVELPPDEINNWLDIPGYEGIYQVSNTGLIRNKKNGKEIKMQTTSTGYKVVTLGPRASKKTYTVHLLVMLAFVGERPGKMDINHKNGVKADNRIENLEYCTHQENMIHAIRNLGVARQHGESHYAAKLTGGQVLEIRKMAESGVSMHALSRMFAVSRPAIKSILRRETWKHI